MLSEIIQYLQSKISSLEYMEEVHGLAELVTQPSGTTTMQFPAVHKSGELTAIDFDTQRTQLFFLLQGGIERETTENPFVGCAYRVKESYMLRAILYKQGMEDVNCQSQSQQIAWNIAKTLTGKHQDLMDSTSLDFILMSAQTINLDKHAIWKSFYTAPDALKEGDILVEIKFKIETEGDEACYVKPPCSMTTGQG